MEDGSTMRSMNEYVRRTYCTTFDAVTLSILPVRVTNIMGGCWR
jgi:hypothetical protein